MKKSIAALALATSLMGCATTGTDPIAVQVANATYKICGFLPDTIKLANLISTLVGGGAIIGQVEQIAQEICDAATAAVTPVTPVTPKSSGLHVAKNIRVVKDITVIVRDVPVTGHFVR